MANLMLHGPDAFTYDRHHETLRDIGPALAPLPAAAPQPSLQRNPTAYSTDHTNARLRRNEALLAQAAAGGPGHPSGSGGGTNGISSSSSGGGGGTDVQRGSRGEAGPAGSREDRAGRIHGMDAVGDAIRSMPIQGSNVGGGVDAYAADGRGAGVTLVKSRSQGSAAAVDTRVATISSTGRGGSGSNGSGGSGGGGVGDVVSGGGSGGSSGLATESERQAPLSRRAMQPSPPDSAPPLTDAQQLAEEFERSMPQYGRPRTISSSSGSGCLSTGASGTLAGQGAVRSTRGASADGSGTYAVGSMRRREPRTSVPGVEVPSHLRGVDHMGHK